MNWTENISKIATHQNLECDVFVAGGGLAGVCAAVSAARTGARVILCQDRSVLGGNNSSEVRMHVCGADQLGQRSEPLCLEARESGLMEEIRLENAARNPQRSWSMNDLILYEKCMAEPNLTLMLDTPITAAQTKNNRICSVIAQRQNTEDIFTINASVFVDCTGDGRLAAEAGARVMRGREGREAYGEAGAQQNPDKHEMGMSLLFQSRDMGRPVPFTLPEWAHKFTEEELKNRDCSYFNYGYWWIEYGGAKDTIKDTPKIRHELLRVLLGVWDYVKNSGKYEADNYALDWFGFLPGKRQSRRICGMYTLSEKDLAEPKGFVDTIAYGGWPFDVHPPGGIHAKAEAPATQHYAPYLYPIPLRCCVSADLNNLMFAGRGISASYIAFASTRVMATCAVIGQGVGTAAAYAAQNGVSAPELCTEPHIQEIQKRLLAEDCFLPGTQVDEENLAEKAIISASSEIPDAPARNVATLPSRSAHGEGGVPSGMIQTGTNRWISREPVTKDNPEWIELKWEHEVVISEIRLIFDTGLHRPLTLTHDKASGMDEKMIWAAQPETIKDYEVLYQTANGWERLIQVTENYQRLNTHDFPAVTTEKLKIVVNATNGLDHARICRVAVYNTF